MVPALSYRLQIDIPNTRLVKGDMNGREIRVTFVPPIEFWLKGKFRCTLWDAGIEVRGYWGKLMVAVPRDLPEIRVESSEGIMLTYKDRLRAELGVAPK